MWWELLMAWRQLYLVGFAVLIMPGRIEQLLISYLVAMVYMLLFAIARPLKDEGDGTRKRESNHRGLLSCFSTVRVAYPHPPRRTNWQTTLPRPVASRSRPSSSFRL